MKRLKNVLSAVLGIDEGIITDDTSPDNTDTWDSFSALVLVSELEKTFNVSFSMEEVTAVKCVGDIKKSLQMRGIRLEGE